MTWHRKEHLRLEVHRLTIANRHLRHQLDEAHASLAKVVEQRRIIAEQYRALRDRYSV